MKYEELERQIEKMTPNLSAEGRMLVGLFMPFCRELSEENQQLQEQINHLREENKRLTDQLAKNSRNSSLPPSRDNNRPVKQQSSTEGSKRTAGGQHGHVGQGGKLKENPDIIVPMTLGDCPECGQDLRRVPLDELIRKQIEDIPLIKTEVTEYQIEVKTCPGCGVRWQAGGCDVQHEFEYGPNVKALAVYLSTYQFIPQKRIKELLRVFGVDISTGTLNNFRKAAAKRIEPFIDVLRQKLVAAPSAHFDETGMKVNGVNHWVHVACTLMVSLFSIHRHRGQKAHQDMGILPKYCGIAHHDSYRPYDDYLQMRDSLCCAHIVRELKFAIECDGQQSWAQPMIELLFCIKKQVEARPDAVADRRWQGRHLKKYQALIAQGLQMNPAAPRPDGQIKGPTKQTKTHNLLVRLRDREQDVLRFMVEPLAEFSNNQAERDLRMNKVRAKVSGGFRAMTPAKEFMHIRSLISTAVKQAICPLQTLSRVFTPGNNAFMCMLNPD